MEDDISRSAEARPEAARDRLSMDQADTTITEDV